MKKKLYKTNWFLWLWVFLFPPVGIILIWACRKEMNTKKKIIFTVGIAILFIVLIALFSSEPTVPTENPTINEQPTLTTTETSATNSIDKTDEYVKAVKSEIQSAINSKDETITDVTLKNGDLRVIVDLSEADPSPLTIEDLAISRAQSITDSILTIEGYDDLWNTITVDFGNIGKITNNKDDIKENAYGRYFPGVNFNFD